jgi:hypothetical protein
VTTADKWRAKFLKEAKEMEKEQVINAHLTGLIYPLKNNITMKLSVMVFSLADN